MGCVYYGVEEFSGFLLRGVIPPCWLEHGTYERTSVRLSTQKFYVSFLVVVEFLVCFFEGTLWCALGMGGSRVVAVVGWLS